jgi:L-fuculose-phosphate aldolase
MPIWEYLNLAMGERGERLSRIRFCDDLREAAPFRGRLGMPCSLSPASLTILVPIGWVRSPLRRTSDAPKQGYEGAPNARIEIESSFLAGLDGIEAGQDVLVLTWLHEARRDVLAVHPRDDERQPLTGVFATRSADRPNPIGLHRVRIRASNSRGSLEVEGLEAIDGTPVVDLKPVLPRTGGW